MADLAIIADDLTGALDAAAPFAMRGVPTVVALSVAALPEALATGARIVGVSTGSREMTPEAARSAVAGAVARLPEGIGLFKKVDSRLKGNIEAELDALPLGQSLVVPAIPEFGRIAVDGRIEGFGVAQPIDIAARLGRHARTARIPDVRTAEDMAAALAEPSDFIIGARGAAEAMACRMAPLAEPRSPALPSGGSAYCVIGSTDPITLHQLAELRRGVPELVDIAAPNGVMTARAAATGLVVLQATPGETAAGSHEVALALGASLRALSPPGDALLVISGGATAQTVLETLGVGMLTLVGEALPGMPVARAGDLTVITKSGGFGEPDCLCRLLAPYAKTGSRVHSHVG